MKRVWMVLGVLTLAVTALGQTTRQGGPPVALPKPPPVDLPKPPDVQLPKPPQLSPREAPRIPVKQPGQDDAQDPASTLPPGFIPADQVDLKSIPAYVETWRGGKRYIKPVVRQPTSQQSVEQRLEWLRLLKQNVTEMPAISWLGWWEVNHQRYLHPPEEGLANAPQVPADVAAALLAATRSGSGPLRGEAALALGMLRRADALDTLKALTRSADNTIKYRAYTAIGLLSTPPAIEFLKSRPQSSPADTIGWALAIGMLEQPPDELMRQLIKLLDGPAPLEAQRLALWALRVHPSPSAHQAARMVLLKTRDPLLFGEALLAVGANADPQDLQMIDQILEPGADIQQFAYYANGSPLHVGTLDPLTVNHRHLAFMALTAYPSITDHDRDLIRDGFERCADIAAGRGAITSRSRVEYGRDFPLRLLALGTHGAAEDVRFMDAMCGLDARLVSPPSENDSGSWRSTDLATPYFRRFPSIGMAAVAMGVHVRTFGLEPPRQDFPTVGAELVSAADGLADRWRVESDFSDARAACALGMGISGKRERFAQEIKNIMPRLRQGQELAYGFGVLALGMLHDPDAVELAGAYLGPATDRLDTEKLIKARVTAAATRRPAINPRSPEPHRALTMTLQEIAACRAMVQGLEALGDSRAIPLLMGEWGKDQGLDVEVARAIAHCRGKAVDDEEQTDAFVRGMLELMRQSRSPDLAGAAAASLGVYYQRQTEPRLARLIEGGDYTARLDRIVSPRASPPLSPAQQEILAIANPWFYLTVHNALAQALRP